MKIASKALRIIERGLLLSGLFLVVMCAFAYVHRFIMFRAEMAKFEAQLESAKVDIAAIEAISDAIHNDGPHQAVETGYSPSGNQRIKSYEANLGESGEVLAVLRIPKLHVEVPVLEGTDEFTLNRGVGRIAGTSRPGQDGNVGLAGHRDGFFRPLKDISAGDSIELITTSGIDVYAVDRVRITGPADVSVLRPSTKPSLTLVTCYPFHFIGPAPQRYVVEASLRQPAIQNQELTERIVSIRRRKQ